MSACKLLLFTIRLDSITAMVKYNPASKAEKSKSSGEDSRESSDNDASSDEAHVKEMIDKFEEIKANTESTLSKTEAYDRLPSHVEVKDGELSLPPETPGSDRPEGQRQSITDLRREILTTKAEYPDESNTEISRRVDCSPTYVDATLRRWSFLLDDPYLYEAFVLQGRQNKDCWRVHYPDGEILTSGSRKQAIDYALREQHSGGEDVRIINPDGDIIDPFDAKSQESEDSEVQTEPVDSDMDDVTVDVAPSESQAQALQDIGDDKSESSVADVSLEVTQLSKVLNGLYRDKQYEVAEDILQQILDE